MIIMFIIIINNIVISSSSNTIKGIAVVFLSCFVIVITFIFHSNYFDFVAKWLALSTRFE